MFHFCTAEALEANKCCKSTFLSAQTFMAVQNVIFSTLLTDRVSMCVYTQGSLCNYECDRFMKVVENMTHCGTANEKMVKFYTTTEN